MVDLEHKKLALLHILDILKYHSDCNHPLTQQEIIDRLESDYGILVERKTISRNIALLKEAGINIESDKRGTYFDDYLLDDSQIHLLIDSILASKHISESQSKELIDRISSLSNKYFKKHIKNIHSLGQRDKTKGLEIAKEFIEIGFDVIATKHTAEFFKENGLDVKEVHKIQEGRPNVVDIISNKEVALIVNTPSGQKSHNDGYSIRRTALMYNVPIVTTLAAAHATVEAIKAKRNCNWEVCSIQTHYNLVL